MTYVKGLLRNQRLLSTLLKGFIRFFFLLKISNNPFHHKVANKWSNLGGTGAN